MYICVCCHQVDMKQSEKTALHVACHEGHQQIVALLLSAGARPEIADDEGDTAYHFAVFG